MCGCLLLFDLEPSRHCSTQQCYCNCRHCPAADTGTREAEYVVPSSHDRPQGCLLGTLPCPETDRANTFPLVYQKFVGLGSRLASCRSETLFYTRLADPGKRGINENSRSSPRARRSRASILTHMCQGLQPPIRHWNQPHPGLVLHFMHQNLLGAAGQGAQAGSPLRPPFPFHARWETQWMTMQVIIELLLITGHTNSFSNYRVITGN